MSEFPYKQPDSNLQPDDEKGSPKPIVPAPLLLRFANYVLDQIFCAFVSMPVLMILALIFGEALQQFLETTPDFLIVLPVVLGYYIFFETTYGKTPAKFITKTVVVDERGMKPTRNQILIRSFARLIPFEAFSFLFFPTRGWHDSLSKTFVVKEDDVVAVGRSGANKQGVNRGGDDVFTA